MAMRAIGLAVMLAVAVPAKAQSQAGMNAAAGGGYRAADAALNASYRTVMARLTPAGRTRLQAAQRAWIASRDAMCRFVANGRDGGSVGPMVQADCLTAETQARTKWLAGYEICAEGDVACPR